MAKRKARKLSIKSTYEPNRLAKTHLLTAYEKLVPTIKYLLKPTEKNGFASNVFLKKSGGKYS